MPKLKPSSFEEHRRIVRACITANQERYDYTDEQLAKLLSITIQTFRKKKQNPDNFTLFEKPQCYQHQSFSDRYHKGL